MHISTETLFVLFILVVVVVVVDLIALMKHYLYSDSC